MGIDASIPLQGLLINRNDENLKQQRYQQGQLQTQQMQQDMQNRQRLSELLPQAMQGDQNAITQLYAVDPNMALKMDEHQREAAKAVTADLTAAVRWADTPEKWQQVQQHYGQKGVDLSPYRFEDREQGLLALGKMNEYLSSAPKAEYRTLEPGGSLIDVSGGQPRVVIAPNDGSYQTGQPVGGGLPRVTDQQSYDAVPPGAQYMTPDGHVRVKGGQSGGGSTGGFPY